MGYLITHQGDSYAPNGKTDTKPADADAANRETERHEIEWLKTHPDKVFLYCKHDPKSVHTWLGTSVATHVYLGPKVNGGLFGFRSYKRSVDCRIFGVRYVGWFYESAGDYCRLRKAKGQCPTCGNTTKPHIKHVLAGNKCLNRSAG